MSLKYSCLPWHVCKNSKPEHFKLNVSPHTGPLAQLLTCMYVHGHHLQSEPHVDTFITSVLTCSYSSNISPKAVTRPIAEEAECRADMFSATTCNGHMNFQYVLPFTAVYL